MFNALRYKNYTSHYIESLTKLYKNSFPLYPIVYYKASKDNSIYDNTIMNGGNYNIIGLSSGLKYYKIYDFPAINLEAMVPSWNETDFGIRTEIGTSMMFPKINFIPNEFDFVSFKNKHISDREIFQISNIDSTYYDKTNPFYKVTLKGSGNFIEQIEKQVIGSLGYIDFMDKIYNYDDYKLIKKLIANLTILSTMYVKNSNQFQLRDIKL